jgi:hypothetical protein
MRVGGVAKISCDSLNAVETIQTNGKPQNTTNSAEAARMRSVRPPNVEVTVIAPPRV